VYITQAVARLKARGRIITTVTVSANLKVIEVIDAEAFLRRTRVVAEVMAPNGRVTVQSFPDAEQLDVWCAFTHTPANRVRNKRYVEAEPSPPASCRFTAMCVPDELDDGSDATWYVYDLLFRASDKVGAGSQSRSLARWTAHEASRVQNESDQDAGLSLSDSCLKLVHAYQFPRLRYRPASVRVTRG
jgi:predicted methyltransferase